MHHIRIQSRLRSLRWILYGCLRLFLPPFLNCSFSPFDAIFTNLLCGTLGLKPTYAIICRHELHDGILHLFSCRLSPLFPWPSNLMDFQIALFLSLITSLWVHRQGYVPLLGLSFFQPFQTIIIESFETFVRPSSLPVKFFRYQYNILTIRDDPPN